MPALFVPRPLALYLIDGVPSSRRAASLERFLSHSQYV
jgi:hypothetical protein